jgi:imidazole glycerol-phosphate synthase subunit HisF
MFRPRIIPVLLIRNNVLVKSVRFKKHKYIGDPLNAVRIFNEHRADELVLLDIDATRQQRCISPDMVKNISEETDMPLAVGGGINTVEQVKELIAAGAEKVVIGSCVYRNETFITEAAHLFGSSSIVVCMDVASNWSGKETVYVQNGGINTRYFPEQFAEKVQRLGAGELIVQSVENDGSMGGYNIDLLRRVGAVTTLPLIALGGAGSLNDLKEAYNKGMATGLAAGSLFIYKGPKQGVLINYPDHINLKSD